MPIETPAWVHDAIFYQIFPDRFARSPRTKHPPGLTFKPWGAPPAEQGFQGGDLRGIVDKLDYLQDLGVTALYLNPIFASAANHRYHTYDYYQVDPLLGGNDALLELLDAAHERELRVVLDGVFNHASRGFWAFHHILETGSNSPYLDWFVIQGWPLRPYQHSKKRPANYQSWWNLPALPEFNTDNPGVRDYLFGVARHWIEFGADGWRLDVPEDIDDDAFWQEFRWVVKTANPEAYICGEIWHEAERWLQGDQFDAVMNYPLLWPTLSHFGAETLRPGYRPQHLPFRPLGVRAFANRIDALLDRYAWSVTLAQLNLLDSHDMARALWIVGEDQSALRLSVLFQMTVPGTPCIYYGDEIGLSAAGDPDCRAAFPWDDEAGWDHDLLAFYRQVIALRRRHPVLRRGTFRRLYAHRHVYAFQRTLDQQEALVIFNRAGEPMTRALRHLEVKTDHFHQAWPPETDQGYRIDGGRLEVTVPPRQALVLIGELS